MRMDASFFQPQGVLGASYRRPRSRIATAICGLVVIAGLVVALVLILALTPQRSDRVVRAVEVTDARTARVALVEAGVLRHPRTFSIIRFLRRQPVRPGSYVLSPHLSVWSLVRVVTTTRPRAERTLTIIEGWNIRDIAQYLEHEGIAQAEELTELVGLPAVDYRFAPPEAPRPKDFTSAFSFLAEKPEFIGLEGYLFPDTYRVYADASVEDIVRRMLENLDRKLTPELRQEVAASGRSLHQIMTMASLIEAEVRQEEDRAIASGILWKRRDRGMLLQVDSSVNYVTGKHDPSVLREDTLVDSSYNTYRYAGLPRGPIGNPGMGAILAALRPQPSPYWFFLTPSDGRTVFSRTFEEHTANIRRYLR